MHTSQVSYFRLFFSDIADRERFEGLVDAFDMEETGIDGVYDLCCAEGSTISLGDAIELLYSDDELLKRDRLDHIIEETHHKGTLMHSELFIDNLSETVDMDEPIGVCQLFDLLTSTLEVASLDAIFLEYAVTTNKHVYGGNHGGSFLVTKYFAVPINYTPDEGIVEIIKYLREHGSTGFGERYVSEFIKPMMGTVACPDLFEEINEALLKMAKTDFEDR